MTLFFSDEDEKIDAVRISHHVDFMFAADDKAFEFYYNFLIYEFDNGHEKLSAKHYLDEPGVVNVHSPLALPLSDFARQVLVYLSLRYLSIQVPSDKGYVPLPDDIREEVGMAAERYMTNQSQ